MCGAPAQDLSLEGIDVATETVIQGVVTRDGQPVGGAYVRLLDSSGEFTAEVVTSATGAFRFFARPGSWTLRALARRCARRTRRSTPSRATSPRRRSPSDRQSIACGGPLTGSPRAIAVHSWRLWAPAERFGSRWWGMPRPATGSPELLRAINVQYGVVSRTQLGGGGFSRKAIARRLDTGAWQRLLPGVVATTSGTPTRQQLLVGAQLWAGPTAAIDGPDACAWYGVRPVPFDLGTVHVVAPFAAAIRSTGYVRVRRTVGDIAIGTATPVLRFVDEATAFVTAARGMRTERDAIAVLSRGLQQGVVTVASLHEARERIGDKWCRNVDGALVAVGVGLRSPGEHDARELILGSRVLPEPRWNQWIDLGDGGGLVCLDALWDDAGYGHEVNGRKYHAWGTQFDEMQTRHDRLTAAGLVIMHNGLTRIRRAGPEVLQQAERGYLRYRGRGLPPGVRLVDAPLRLSTP